MFELTAVANELLLPLTELLAYFEDMKACLTEFYTSDPMIPVEFLSAKPGANCPR